MNGKEFIKAVDLITKEKGIDREVVFEAMELALATAYKKNFNGNTNSKVTIDKDTGDIHVYSYKTVVDDAMAEDDYYEKMLDSLPEPELDENGEEKEVEIEEYNPEYHITLTEARKIDKKLNIGDTIDTEVTPHDFGRVAASTAKQVITQKIREAEKNSIVEEYADKQDELMVGILAMEDAKNYYVDLGRTRGILPKSEMIPGEEVEMGSSIKVYVQKVEIGNKGPLILLSRKFYGFVKRLFEQEIPEFQDGTLILHAVAREAGVRSKVAIASTNPKVDPVGSCIGEKGRRIANIITELGGEKVDLIAYSIDPEEFIANALSPAKNLNVSITDEKKKEALVIADDENLSLAIGKKGINIKLASRLTKYTINIKTLDDINKQINA